MVKSIDGQAIVYCEGAFNTPNGKTAHGLVRYTRRYLVKAIIDSRYAGKDAGEILDGKKKNIPIIASLEEAYKGLIKTKSDFAAFNKLFGSYKDGRNIIASTMTDLGEIIGRDKFYNSLLAGDKAAKARGEPGMFYKTYAAARTNLPNP